MTQVYDRKRATLSRLDGVLPLRAAAAGRGSGEVACIRRSGGLMLIKRLGVRVEQGRMGIGSLTVS